MNFAGSIPESRTVFEQFILNNLGISFDMSNSVIIMAVIALALVGPVKRMLNSTAGMR